MAINAWWLDDPDQRYWMEITNRPDLGSDLKAPQVDDAGRPNWTYNLVTQVRDGDVVVHWHKNMYDEPGIVGYSIVAGAPYQSTITWASRGTYGRTHAPSGAEPSWMCDLRDYRALTTPVLQGDLRAVESSLRSVSAKLRRTYKGALYLPFAFSDKRPVRATQGYLVTFPAGMVDVFKGLRTIPRVSRLTAPAPPSQPRRANGAGRITDVALRKALERHAVLRACEYYVALGYDKAEVLDVGDQESYDLRVGSGRDKRHVEVKGSSVADIASIEVTAGEVRNCLGALTDLFVVDGISWIREPDGSITTSGGHARIWRAWEAQETSLKPVRYRYTLSRSGFLELDD